MISANHETTSQANPKMQTSEDVLISPLMSPLSHGRAFPRKELPEAGEGWADAEGRLFLPLANVSQGGILCAQALTCYLSDAKCSKAQSTTVGPLKAR